MYCRSILLVTFILREESSGVTTDVKALQYHLTEQTVSVICFMKGLTCMSELLHVRYFPH